MSEQWLCKKGCKAHMMADIPGNGKDGIYYAVCSPSRPLKGFIVSDSPYMFGSECCSRCFLAQLESVPAYGPGINGVFADDDFFSRMMDFFEKSESEKLRVEDGGDDWSQFSAFLRASSSVTQRVDATKQPRGGFISPKKFEKIVLDGGGADDLHPSENVHASLVGLAVDYLTRFMTGTSAEKVFAVSKSGATYVQKLDLFEQLLSSIKGLDHDSIVAAVKLSGFDSAARAGMMAYRSVEDITPDVYTVENVRVMVERSLRFFEQYGPKVLDHLTFEGGYTRQAMSGDGDFLTSDTLWDFKVSKYGLSSKHTLQLFMYWRMGLHSIHSEYEKVRYIGVYNPRLNIVYRLDVRVIPAFLVQFLEATVIGYDPVPPASKP